MPSRGIYVETSIRGSMDELWQKTQQPELHQQWDLRFTTITYLSRADGEPQRFLYATRIGFGLAIEGEGESIGEKLSDDERTSSLRFWSQDPKSLISEGSGYWRYIQRPSVIRFFTWYDYQTRMGAAGKLVDLLFRPLIGWATAWSFDRLRLWIETGNPPQTVLRSTSIYSLCRACVVTIWLWHGLVPKLLFPHIDELRLMQAAGLPARWLPLVGSLECGWALAGLVAWRWRGFLSISAVAMLLATITVLCTAPGFVLHAFNPLTLNLAVVALCSAAWIAHAQTAFAGNCLRRPRED